MAPAQAGNYSYRCNIHPDRMRAVLVVVGQNGPDPTKPEAEKTAAAPASPGGGIATMALATGVG